MEGISNLSILLSIKEETQDIRATKSAMEGIIESITEI